METPVNAPIKEKIRLEFVKLREMNFKEKREYIWEYYKFHIVCFFVLIFILISVLNIYVFNPRPDTVLFISWNAGFATDEQIDALIDALEERLVDKDANEEVAISQVFFSSGDAEADMANVQRTVAMIAAGMIDVFIADLNLLRDYANVGYLQPLDSVLAEIRAKNPEVYRRIEENIISAPTETNQEEKEERMVGISIGSSPLFTRLGIFRQELYIGVAISSTKLDNVAEAIIMLFEE